MEHLLNLFWVICSLGLFTSVARARSAGQLRCSVKLAFACTALLALLLFPALSMTDDLQQARLDVETNARHLDTTFLLGSLEDGQCLAGAVTAAFLLLLIALGRGAGVLRLPPVLAGALRGRMPDFRPLAVRPPPALAI